MKLQIPKFPIYTLYKDKSLQLNYNSIALDDSVNSTIK